MTEPKEDMSVTMRRIGKIARANDQLIDLIAHTIYGPGYEHAEDWEVEGEENTASDLIEALGLQPEFDDTETLIRYTTPWEPA